jgi:hypothetical protein
MRILLEVLGNSFVTVPAVATFLLILNLCPFGRLALPGFRYVLVYTHELHTSINARNKT